MIETTALRREDLMRARLGSFHRRVDRALAFLSELSRSDANYYVAFSGGKDSLVALDLWRRVVGDRAHALWTDDELEYPEQLVYIPSLCNALGVTLTSKTGTQTHAEWFTSWSMKPFWRDPLPDTLITTKRAAEVASDLGYDGVILGVRASERAYRRTHLMAHGMVYELGDGQWRANPLAWWSTDDIWAYIAMQEIPYNPVYDRLARIGVPRDQQRIGPLPLSEGWMLKRGWPEMFVRLEARYGRKWGPA